MGSNRQTVLSVFDRSGFKWFHMKSILTTGMGVFTDGYDLSSVGIVLPLALASFGQKSLTGLESSLLAGSALFGAVIGAVIFGLLANRGRKKFYGIDVGLLAVMALAQAFVTNIWMLILVRLALGIGVGADYVLSPMIMGEHANVKDRGKSMAIGFGLTWTVGAAFASLLYLALEAYHLPGNLVWRIVLGAGAIPALSVIYLRRRMPETPRYLARVAGDGAYLAKVAAELTGPLTPEMVQSITREGELVKDRAQIGDYLRRNARQIAAACLLWFLFDIVAYSGILFGPSLIAKGIGLTAGTFNLFMQVFATIPGALVAALLIDRVGRKPLQALGFLGMGLALFLFALSHSSIVAAPLLGAVIYAGVNFFQQAGPGSISASGMLGVELAPTKVRGIVQSMTVASGRIGASLTAFVFPALIAAYGVSTALVVLGVLALVALLITVAFIPETKKRSLEEASGEDLVGQMQVVMSD